MNPSHNKIEIPTVGTAGHGHVPRNSGALTMRMACDEWLRKRGLTSSQTRPQPRAKK